MSGSNQPIATISEFLGWVKKISDGRTILYRGLSKHTYPVEATLVRRLEKVYKAAKISKEQFHDLFIAASADIIDSAIIKGYHNKDGHKMADLEIMAELQHYGAATCLIDFTRNPLVALWFACRSNLEKPGKIVALDSGDDKIMHITSDNIGNADGKIHERMKKMLGEIKEDGYNDGKSIRIWEPAHQNKRITAQQSVFVFGPANIDNAIYREIVVDGQAQKSLLEELRTYGISAESLFCDFDGFARILNAHEKSYPDSAESCYRIGEKNLDNNNYDLAVKFYDMALSHKAPYKKAFYKRGRAYSLQEQWKEAIANYDKAIRFESDNMDAYIHRITAKMMIGRHKNAFNDCNKAVKINSNNPTIYVLRGNANSNLGNYRDAIADYNKALKINPKYAGAHYNCGNSKAALGKYSNAIADYNEAIKINPKHADAYCNRGNCKSALGEYRDAITDYNEAIKINPKHVNAHYNRGNSKFNLGEHRDAITDYNEAIKINPKNASAYCNRGISKAVLGKNRDAIADFNEAIKINPKNANAYYSRGNSKLNLGKHRDAIADYNKVIRINPQYADAYYGRGITKLRIDDKKGAMKDFQEAHKINPDMKIPNIK